ncbi:MAG: isochorismatase family protein, partial [Gemmatimonadaceae bacterium]
GDVLIRKHRFDVFSNPNTGTVIEAWDPTEIVIYGVTLDYCVKYAIDGLIDIGIPTIHLVLDATKPIVERAVEALVGGWVKEDVRIVSTHDVVAGRIV